MLAQRQFGGKFAQRAVGGGERGAAPIAGDGVNEGVRLGGGGEFGCCADQLFDLFTEIMCMRLRSIVAGEFGGYDCGKHFTLHTRER